jgi:hypothetical protein
VTELSVKRAENDIVLRFTVPTANTDGSGPADLRRVEVYGHTGALARVEDFVEYGTLVSSVEIKNPADVQPSEQGAEKKPPRPADAAMVEQGWATTVRDTLTPKHFEPGPMPPAPRPVAGKIPVAPVETLETPGTVNLDAAPARYYTVVTVSRSRSRRSRFAGPVRVPLVEPLAPPEKVELAYTAAAISLKWPSLPEDVTPPATAVLQPLATPPLPEETEGTVSLYSDVETEGTRNPPSAPAPQGKVPPPAARFGYNVYEASSGATGASVTSPGAAGATGADKGAAGADKGADKGAAGVDTGAAGASSANPGAPVMPLNTALLTISAFNDPRVEFGTERCYVVRRVQVANAVAIESAPSPKVCVTPVDTFPPTPPKSLQSIASGGQVSLLWEANPESDLGGYLVLRGEAPGDKLSPLTPAPIRDTSFVDNTVRRGRTYVYEVVAVDQQVPVNTSAPSNRVEEAIR